MWKDSFSSGHATDDNIRRIRFACFRTTATGTYSEYVILLAFPLQQWLHKRVAILRYAYVVCFLAHSRDSTLERKTKTTLSQLQHEQVW